MAVSSEATTKNALGSGERPAPTSFWREQEFWFVLLLVLGIYFARPTTLTIRGEESRWANVAREMIESGDWIVPREQGAVFPSRPPLSNWAIACSIMVFGNSEAFAVRFPALAATLLTTLLIYVCGRSFLDRFGALVAACGYATMAQVLQIGRHAETEPMFTLFIAAALLSWLNCYLRGRAPWITWTVGYAFAGLAAITKGPQGPIYFVGSTWLFLLFFDWKFLLRRGHLLGIFVFAAIVASWQIPYYFATDLPTSLQVWGRESANRFTDLDVMKSLAHAAKFTFEIINCTLPWSGLLICFGDRGLRSRLGTMKRPVQFLAMSTVLCLLPLLLAYAARGRYFMPLYPSIALLCGAAAQAAVAAQPESFARRLWRGALRASMLVPVVVTCYAAWQSSPWSAQLPKIYNPTAAQAWPLVVAIGLCAGVMIWFCRRAIADRSEQLSYRAATSAVCAAAIFYAFAFTTFGVNSLEAYSYDNRADVRRVVAKLPADAKLVSFTVVNHLFSYHLANMDPRRIELRSMTSVEGAENSDWEYFCYTIAADNLHSFPMPFEWEEVGVVTVDRNRYDRRREYVVVGRKLPPASQTAAVSADKRS